MEDQWSKEMQIEKLNEMLITLSVLSIRHRSSVDDEVINYRGKVIQYVRELVDSKEQIQPI